jgi:hypothetical protein
MWAIVVAEQNGVGRHPQRVHQVHDVAEEKAIVNSTLKGTDMTELTIPGDHLTSDGAGFSNTRVGSECAMRTRAVVQVDRHGNQFYYADGDIDFIIIDGRRPRDRVYALSRHQVAPAVIDELIGNDRIGRLGDMPVTEQAIGAFTNSHPFHSRNSLSLLGERTSNDD